MGPQILFIFVALLCLTFTTAIPQDFHQHIELFKKAKKVLTWTTLAELITTKASNSDTLDPCVSSLSNAINHFMSSPEMAAFILYSGKNIYDPGDYNACKNTAGSYYARLAVHIESAYDIVIRMQFCLPRICSKDYLDTQKPVFSSVIGKLLDIEIAEKDITFFDIAAENAELNKLGIGFWCTMLWFGIMVTLVIVMTFLDYHGMLKGQSKGTQLALSFSLQKNLRSLFSNENRIDPKLNVFNGVRVLSISWVVLNHSWLAIPYEALFNLADTVDEVPLKLIMSFIKAAPLAVDVFFVVSGFLCALSLCSAFKDPKNRTIKNALLAILNRFLRFFPMHLVALLYTVNILPAAADTPNNPICSDFLVKPCLTQWPVTLLHVNNFLKSFHDMCMSWTWYLNVDMQFFIITIPLIWLYLNKKRNCFLAMLGCCLICLSCQIYLCIEYRLHKSYMKPLKADMLTLFFQKPYTRINTYLIGMFLYFAYEDSRKEEGKGFDLPFKKLQHLVYDNDLVRYGFYAVGFCTMSFIVFTTWLVDEYWKSYTDFMGALDVILSRPLFAIAFVMMIYPVLIGKGKNILSILAFSAFGPLGKITFGVYILHLQFYFHHVQNTLHYFYYTDSFYFSRVLGVLLMGFIFSFVVSLTIEVPCMQIQKILLGPGQAHRPAAGAKPEKKEVEKEKLTDGADEKPKEIKTTEG